MSLDSTGRPKVSIVMPVFNGGTFFEPAIQSALNQTYENIEILIVNDGSNDHGVTDSIARRYQEANSTKIKYIVQDNTGVAGALNTGIDQMTGDFFCWLSHDDLYHPTKIEKHLDAVLHCEIRDVLLYGDWEYIGPNDEHLYPVILDNPDQRGPSIAAVLGGAINGCTVMIPRHLLHENKFDPRYRHTQDYRLWFELSKTAIFIRHPEILVKQRLHPGQDSNRLKDVSIREGESLWRDMVFGTSRVLRAAMDGSDSRYLRRMASRLSQMPYPRVAAEVAEAAERALDSIEVTLIVLVDQQFVSPEQVEQLNFLSFGNDLQILLIASLGCIKELSERIEIVPDMRHALLTTSGDYISFGRLGNLPLRVSLRRHAAAMSKSGHFVSLIEEYAAIDAKTSIMETMIDDTISLTKMMIHRYLIASGEFSAFDMDDQLSSNCVRVLAIRDVNYCNVLNGELM